MTDVSAVFERLKKNKLFVPALAIGAVAGGYFLLKGGGGGGGITAQDKATPDPNPQATGGSGGGGGDTSGQTDSAIAGLQSQQQNFMQSLVDQFNALTQSVQSALSGQQSATQAALDSLAGQIQNQQQLQSQPTPALGGLTDFSSLVSALQAIPSQVQQQQSYKSPMLNLGSLNGVRIQPSYAPGNSTGSVRIGSIGNQLVNAISNVSSIQRSSFGLQKNPITLNLTRPVTVSSPIGRPASLPIRGASRPSQPIRVSPAPRITAGRRVQIP